MRYQSLEYENLNDHKHLREDEYFRIGLSDDTDSTFELDLLIASSDAKRGLFEQAVNLVQMWNRYD